MYAWAKATKSTWLILRKQIGDGFSVMAKADNEQGAILICDALNNSIDAREAEKRKRKAEEDLKCAELRVKKARGVVADALKEKEDIKNDIRILENKVSSMQEYENDLRNRVRELERAANQLETNEELGGN